MSLDDEGYRDLQGCMNDFEPDGDTEMLGGLGGMLPWKYIF